MPEEEVLYPAMYKSRSRTWNGFSGHIQVDSGYGFTCDEGIADVVRALWASGFETSGSCENTNRVESTPCAQITIEHSDPHLLLDLCLHIRQSLPTGNGWSLELNIFYDDILVDLKIWKQRHAEILEAIRTFVR